MLADYPIFVILNPIYKLKLKTQFPKGFRVVIYWESDFLERGGVWVDGRDV